jgi:glycerol kinase
VKRPAVIETTSLGAAYLAGLGSGLWRSLDAVAERHTIERSFRPSADPTARAEGYAGWRRAVERARDWTA